MNPNQEPTGAVPTPKANYDRLIPAIQYLINEATYEGRTMSERHPEETNPGTPV